jgi:uncharacterized membrane protein
MRFKNLDLIAAILVVAINVGWTQLPHRPLVIGIILALPLILILPGYTLTQTLFRKRLPAPDPSSKLILRPSLKIGQPINTADHIILSFGLSMAIDVVVGFALNVLPIGLQALSWTLSLGIITTVFALLAVFLRRKDIVRVAMMPRPRITIYECILFGLAILLATLVVWSSIIRPLEEPQPSFTQFWMLPAKNNSCAVLIGVHSFESTSVTYRVVMTINGAQVTTWPSVVLAPQAEWDQSVSIKKGATDNMYIEARIYRGDKPDTVYRNVHLTFHSLKRSNNGQTQQCSIGT